MSAIDEIGLLKVAGIAFRAHVIAQAASAGLDGGGERFPDGENQFFATQQGNPASGEARMNTGAKQRLACINVAHTDDYVTVHHDGFYRSAATAGVGVQPS